MKAITDQTAAANVGAEHRLRTNAPATREVIEQTAMAKEIVYDTL